MNSLDKVRKRGQLSLAMGMLALCALLAGCAGEFGTHRREVTPPPDALSSAADALPSAPLPGEPKNLAVVERATFAQEHCASADRDPSATARATDCPSFGATACSAAGDAAVQPATCGFVGAAASGHPTIYVASRATACAATRTTTCAGIRSTIMAATARQTIRTTAPAIGQRGNAAAGADPAATRNRRRSECRRLDAHAALFVTRRLAHYAAR